MMDRLTWLEATQRDVNTEDPLRFIEKSSSYELHRDEEAGLVPKGVFLHKAIVTSYFAPYASM